MKKSFIPPGKEFFFLSKHVHNIHYERFYFQRDKRE